MVVWVKIMVGWVSLVGGGWDRDDGEVGGGVGREGVG